MPNNTDETRDNLFEILKASNKKIKNSIYWALFYSLFINLLLLSIPIYSLQVFDRVLSSQSEATLLYLTILIGWFIIIYTLLDWVRSRLLSYAATTWQEEISKSTILYSLHLSTREQRKELIQLTENIKTAISHNLNAAIDVPWAPLFILILTLLHPLYGIISLISVIALFIIGGIYYQKNKSITAIPTANLSPLNDSTTIRSLGMTSAITNKISKEAKAYRDSAYKKRNRSINASSITKSIRLVTQISIIGTGAILVIDKELTAGAMIAATMISGRALAPFESLALNLTDWLKTKATWEKLIEISSTSPLSHPNTTLPKPSGKISAKGIMLLYPNSQTPFLSSINIEINRGSCFAIIGSSGSGKSSLLSVLAGLKTPNLGSVRLDGATYTQWEQDLLGKNIGYYTAESCFYTGTIKENISRFANTKADTEVIAACQAIGMHETILSWPNGYDTDIVNDFEPSQSERQRLLIARALYSSPNIIFFDEPDSFLDPTSLKDLEEIFKKRRRSNQTTVFTTNRSELLSTSNSLVVLNKGRIIKTGSPQALQAPEEPHTPKELTNN